MILWVADYYDSELLIWYLWKSVFLLPESYNVNSFLEFFYAQCYFFYSLYSIYFNFFRVFFPFIFILWRLLLYNIVVVFAIHWHESAWIYMCSPSRSPLLPPSPSHPSGSSQCTSPEHPSHASNLGWWSVSPLIVYLFQCCSLWTFHPRLLPQSLKFCSVDLCLFFCFAYRAILCETGKM